MRLSLRDLICWNRLLDRFYELSIFDILGLLVFFFSRIYSDLVG